MKRIGLIIGQLTWGGAERQLTELATRLRSKGFEPFVYCLSEAADPYGPMLESRSIPVRTFPRRSHFDLSRVISLRRQLARDRIDLAHSWLLNDDAYNALAHLFHSRPWVVSMRSRPLDRDAVRLQLDRWVFRRARAVVANEVEVVDYLEARMGCPREKVHVIHNGIDLARLEPVRSRSEVRAELSTPADVPVILFAGRHEEVKNIPLLLESFRTMRSEGGNGYLWLAGDGTKRSDFEGQVGDMGLKESVRFTGVRADLPDLMHAANLFVLCSYSEGLPNVVLEAMGTGTPAIVSPTAGCGRVVQSGVNGWVVEEQSPAAYAAVFHQALGDMAELEKIGIAARETIESRFSVETMVLEMTKLYDSLLEG